MLNHPAICVPSISNFGCCDSGPLRSIHNRILVDRWDELKIAQGGRRDYRVDTLALRQEQLHFSYVLIR